MEPEAIMASFVATEDARRFRQTEALRYSVPAQQAHESLWLQVFVDQVEITNGHHLLAVHPRCYRREQDILDPLHYLPVLEQRPGAWKQAKPI